jgi:hypothetical protein
MGVHPGLYERLVASGVATRFERVTTEHKKLLTSCMRRPFFERRALLVKGIIPTCG